MISKAFAAVITVLLMAAPALAENSSSDNVVARYSFSKVPDGFLRLDTQTGEVSLCGQQAVGWACVAAPEDRAALENEITRLRRENGTLKKELLFHDLPLPPGAMPEPPAASDNKDLSVRVPGNADVDRVIVFIGLVWHRLVAVIADAQNQLLHRG